MCAAAWKDTQLQTDGSAFNRAAPGNRGDSSARLM